MKNETLKELLVNEIQDLYSCENQLIKALPRLAKAAASPELKSAFETHLEETKSHAERLEKVADILGESPKGMKCKGIEGIIAECKNAMDEHDDPEVLDAALICEAQKAEHYEIATYGTAKAWAEMLDLPDAAELLEQTLNEEKNADQKLTALAVDTVNVEAMA